jgi:hypothetical protein
MIGSRVTVRFVICLGMTATKLLQQLGIHQKQKLCLKPKKVWVPKQPVVVTNATVNTPEHAPTVVNSGADVGWKVVTRRARNHNQAKRATSPNNTFYALDEMEGDHDEEEGELNPTEDTIPPDK